MDNTLLQEKLNLIQRLAETNDKDILMKIKALLFNEQDTSESSLIPDWFMPELLERKRAYENGEAKTVSWDECKKTLLQRVEK